MYNSIVLMTQECQLPMKGYCDDRSWYMKLYYALNKVTVTVSQVGSGCCPGVISEYRLSTDRIHQTLINSYIIVICSYI
jgi:hypothetical protein